MLVVAGLSLKNLHPRVWDPASPHWLPDLRAVMVSYADFHRLPRRRATAMERGLRAYLGVSDDVSIYLDNGAFYFLAKDGEMPTAAYEAFVREARPDWYAVPRDYIPTPQMGDAEQVACLERTMTVNRAYRHDGFVPVIHISRRLPEYLSQFQADAGLMRKPRVALGGIVPNLLRRPKAMPYDTVVESLRQVRAGLAGRHLHVFGIGGTATLHLAALFALDSVDSAGWRNRAARGIVQLPGGGDRMVANLGSWRGRVPSEDEWQRLRGCPCPACQRDGLVGLRAQGLAGFAHRATHNLWVLLEEARLVEGRLADGTYHDWYEEHLDNSIYLPLIRAAVRERGR